MEKVNSLNIFKIFFKIGAILLGGGYVILPIMKTELVEKRNWLTEEELFDFYCVSQCLPGIIAVNMSILTGHKINRLKGAIVALFAMSLSPVISIIIIANAISKIISISFINGLFWGINLSVIILIYLTLKEMWQKSLKDFFGYFWFFVIFILSILKVNPVILIISSIMLGVLIQAIKNIKGDKNAD